MMWNKTVALFIDDTSIRLLVNQGKRVKKWADVQLEPGLIKDSMILKEAEVAAHIRKLLDGQQVTSRKIVVGFSGLHSLTRPINLPQLPKAMLAEAVAREARRILPVPLDQLYLSWQMLPSPKGRTQVFIAAIPRKNADILIKVLHSIGLTPKRMTIKPLALTKVLPVNTAMLVDLQATEFDIVVMVDGISQPIRTVTFPDEELTYAKKMNLICNELERTIKFYDTNNQERPLHKSVPIYVSGELLGKPELQKVLAEATEHPTMALVPEFKGLEKLDLGRYITNLAIVLDDPSPVRDATFAAADLNLLPAPYQTKPPSLPKLIGIPAGAAVIGLVIYLVMSMQGNAGHIAQLQTELDTVNQQINLKMKEQANLKAQIADTEKKIEAAKQLNTSLQIAQASIVTQQEKVTGDVRLALTKLSSAIQIHSIKAMDGILTITGTTPTKEDIYSYAQAFLNYTRSLDESERFTESTIMEMATTGSGENEAIEFTLNFHRGNVK